MAKVLRKDVGDKNYADVQQMILNAADGDSVIEKVLDEVTVVGSGKGKFDLYNKTIPSYMKKYAKKWNAKVYDTKLARKVFDGDVGDMVELDPIDDIPVTVLELSPEMKKDVVSSSQPLFEIFGTVSLSTWAASEVSDSMENNIISQTTENMY